MTIELRTRAEQAAARRLANLDRGARFLSTHAGYLENWHDNLIDGVTPLDFEADLLQAGGSELTDQPGEPAKFRAAFSSSALGVNSFAPFRRHPERLLIDGISGFTETRFEYPCPDGLKGMSPHFDFWGLSPQTVLAVESKFLETLSPHRADFSPQYLGPFLGTETAAAIAEKPWSAVFSALRDDPGIYTHLDAAQLVKHYLGLRHSFPERQRVIAYVFWEPTNASNHYEFVAHRKEVADLSRRVGGCDTRFVAMSYRDLRSEWQDDSTWPGMLVHLERLRARYSFAI
jgi:Restriction Endonuclease associating with ARP